MFKYKMKVVSKTGSIMLCAALLTGCGSAAAKGSRISGGNSVDKVMESQIAAADKDNTSNEKETENTNWQNYLEESSETGESVKNQKGDESVDIDLTVMSSDMIYATVYQLMFESEDYEDKTIKMRGTYYASWYERTQKYYHCVIIKDATACCSQGLEFIWEDGSHIYPDEYPADETEVEVKGTFEIYTEDGYEYCRLKDASLQVIE